MKESILRRSKTPDSLSNQSISTRNNQSLTSSSTEDPLCSQGNYTFCQNQNDFHPIESNSPEEDNAGQSTSPNKNILTTYGSTDEEIDIINSIRNLYYDSTVWYNTYSIHKEAIFMAWKAKITIIDHSNSWYVFIG